MTSFYAFDPRIQAITADQARAIAAGQVNGGAERYDLAAARQQHAVPSRVLTEIDTELVFRDATLAVASHQATAGYASYVYQWDYAPADDPAHIGAAHCGELPFFFNNIDAYPDSPMLGTPNPEVRRLAATFSRTVAAFVATGRPADDQWQNYEPGNPATVRHFA
jgi:para-nitrobenzyl esterase